MDFAHARGGAVGRALPLRGPISPDHATLLRHHRAVFAPELVVPELPGHPKDGPEHVGRQRRLRFPWLLLGV
jgi:hypothetical protein